jgi:hypothetical protein
VVSMTSRRVHMASGRAHIPSGRLLGVLIAACLGLGLLGAAGAAAETVSFTTPGCTAWTAPIGSHFQVQATGAQGAPAGSYIFPVTPEEVLNSGGAGGRADVVSADLATITTGAHLYVCVDVGGGAGGSSEGESRCEELRGFGGCFTGGAGGGASGISLAGDFSQPLLVAGGGGGGGALSPYGLGAPAYAGGAAGEAGGGGPRELREPFQADDQYFGNGGGGASSTQAGTGGTEGTDGTAGSAGSPYTAAGPGKGGNGGFGEFNGPCNSSPCEGAGGGGGGGGYYGGGGGGGAGIDGAGGGGGASLVPAGGAATLAGEAATPQVQVSYVPGPSSVSEAASAVRQTSAILNATVDPDARTVTDCHFEYGETEGYGSIAPCEQSPGAGRNPVAVSASLESLNPKTPYHFRIVATNEGGTSYGGDETFETLPDAPAVTSVSPDAGFESGGTSVTITGIGFGEATAVRFGSTSAAHFTIGSPTSITATAPAGSPGTVQVTVENTGGASAAGAGDEFTYVAPGHAPTIKKLSAKKGPAAGGTLVTITGTSFLGVTAVDFGATPATSFTVNSPTSITAVSPAQTTGAVEVVVTTPNGESGFTSKDQFKYGAPTITRVSPSTGTKLGGTPVTITGSGFALGKATSFAFGKTPSASVSCSSSTTCDVVAPAAAKTGAVDLLATVGKTKSKKNPTSGRFTYN